MLCGGGTSVGPAGVIGAPPAPRNPLSTGECGGTGSTAEPGARGMAETVAG